MAFLLGTAWAGLVLAGAWRLRPLPARLPPLPPVLAARSHSMECDLAARTGSTGRRRLLAVGLGVVALVVAPPLVPVVAAVAWGLPVLRRRRERRGAEAQLRSTLPEVVDLLALAVGAGLTVSLAVAAVAARAGGPVAEGLAAASREVVDGRRLADALDDLVPRLGERVRPLVAVLTASERYGVPLLPSLERLAAEVRAERRRAAEEAARRVPVKLLFPLVCCTLPAFALLTVVPLVAGSLAGFRLP